jgi:hypothetical protein
MSRALVTAIPVLDASVWVVGSVNVVGTYIIHIKVSINKIQEEKRKKKHLLMASFGPVFVVSLSHLVP